MSEYDEECMDKLQNLDEKDFAELKESADNYLKDAQERAGPERARAEAGLKNLHYHLWENPEYGAGQNMGTNGG